MKRFFLGVLAAILGLSAWWVLAPRWVALGTDGGACYVADRLGRVYRIRSGEMVPIYAMPEGWAVWSAPITGGGR